MNADPQELEKFSALAHRWWDPESEFKPWASFGLERGPTALLTTPP